MAQPEELRLSDREMARVKAYADERGLTVDEAVTELARQAIANKFRKAVNRGPATVYQIPRKK